MSDPHLKVLVTRSGFSFQDLVYRRRRCPCTEEFCNESVSTGAVELENLPLRKDALREFDLPFEVKAGETPRLKCTMSTSAPSHTLHHFKIKEST